MIKSEFGEVTIKGFKGMIMLDIVKQEIENGLE
jgi:hypothetical protein